MEKSEVIILCGGKGTRMGEETEKKPKQMPSKQIIAIEPLNKNYKLLNENIKINHFTNCKTMKNAVSNNKGILKFFINPIYS